MADLSVSPLPQPPPSLLHPHTALAHHTQHSAAQHAGGTWPSQTARAPRVQRGQACSQGNSVPDWPRHGRLRRSATRSNGWHFFLSCFWQWLSDSTIHAATTFLRVICVLCSSVSPFVCVCCFSCFFRLFFLFLFVSVFVATAPFSSVRRVRSSEQAAGRFGRRRADELAFPPITLPQRPTRNTTTTAVHTQRTNNSIAASNPHVRTTVNSRRAQRPPFRSPR